MECGIKPNKKMLTNSYFQELLVEFMLMQQNIFLKAAELAKPKKFIILCDRGIMDTRPYMSDALLKKILKKFGHTIHTARETLYDGVIHLQSTVVD